MKRKIAVIAVFLVLLFGQGCTVSKGPKTTWTPANAARLADAPTVRDDLDANSLLEAISRSIAYFERKEPEQTVRFANLEISYGQLRTSLVDFKNQLEQLGLTEPFFQYVRENFAFLQTAGDRPLFTGYFEARLRGSRSRTDTYSYPLYRRPDDLFHVELPHYKDSGQRAKRSV